MDRIVWDGAAAERVISQLREAARLLEDCGGELRLDCAAGAELFRENMGASRRIMEQAESMLRRTERLRERTQMLTGALLRAAGQVAAAEGSLESMMAALPTGTGADSAAVPIPAAGPVHTDGASEYCPPAPVVFVPPMRTLYPVTTPWLVQAADTMLGF